jgi:hypothetical protein
MRTLPSLGSSAETAASVAVLQRFMATTLLLHYSVRLGIQQKYPLPQRNVSVEVVVVCISGFGIGHLLKKSEKSNLLELLIVDKAA